MRKQLKVRLHCTQGDLTLGQVVIKRVAVVKLGVNNGSGGGGSCFGIEVWTDTAKLANMVIAGQSKT